MFLISDAYAADATAAPAAGPGSGGNMLASFGGSQTLMLVIIMAAFFFLMIRPQMKRQKEMKAMMAALVKGDEVVTSGGLLGKITGLSDSSVDLQIASGVEIQLQRNAIVQVLPKGTLKIKD